MANRLSPPDLLFFYVGSNDLTSNCVTSKSFIHTAQCTLYRYHALWPNTRLVWSCLLSRRYWHYVPLEYGSTINKKRVRMNKVMKKSMCSKLMGYSIEHDHNNTGKEINIYVRTALTCLSLGIKNFLTIRKQQSSFFYKTAKPSILPNSYLLCNAKALPNFL